MKIILCCEMMNIHVHLWKLSCNMDIVFNNIKWEKWFSVGYCRENADILFMSYGT